MYLSTNIIMTGTFTETVSPMLILIRLIDEYDVPLAKAFANGYYDQMVFLIRNLLEQALKTNSSLKLAVLTGCMRISKESIFTGLNNFTTFTIADVDFDEYFGFTNQEVRGRILSMGCSFLSSKSAYKQRSNSSELLDHYK